MLTTLTEPAPVVSFSRGYVETDRDRMWGEETIAGTRVPTYRVVELVVEGGYTPEEVCRDIYVHLTVDQVRGALDASGVNHIATTSSGSAIQLRNLASTGTDLLHSPSD